MKKIISTFILTLFLSVAFTVHSANIQELNMNDFNTDCFRVLDGDREVYNSCEETLGASVTELVGTDLQSVFPTLYNANLNSINNNKLENSDFTGSTGITYAATGTISFDCSEVEGSGIDCVGEAITLGTNASTTNRDAYASFDTPVFFATSSLLLTTSSTTFPLGETICPPGQAGCTVEWNTVNCYTTTGTADIQCGDGTASTSLISATTATSTAQTDYTFQDGDKNLCEIGNVSSAGVGVTCTAGIILY